MQELKTDPYACAGCGKDSATMDICEDGGAYCGQCKAYFCYDCFGLSDFGMCGDCADEVQHDILET